MEGVSERPDTFFRLSPADAANARTFALQRGSLAGRLDSWFYHPQYELLNARLDAAPIEKIALGELLVSIAGGATPSRSDASLYADSGVKFFRILNVGDGEILDQDLKYITDAVHKDELGRSQLAAGDVLMTITGRVGSAAVVGTEHLPANINQHIARLRIDKKRCRPEFLSEWLNCPAGLELSNRFVSGGTRAALDYGAIRNLRLPLPASFETQDKLLATMDAARAKRKAKLAEADVLLAGIDDFLLDGLGITLPSEDSRRVFAINRGDLTGLSLGPSHYAPELRNYLKILCNHPAYTKPLSSYVDVNPSLDISRMDAEAVVGFIPMQAVSDGATGEYTVTSRPLKEVSKGYTPFINGDILWAKITPCMQNGKSCILDGLPNGVGFGSTEFHVLRVRAAGISKEFVIEFVSQASLRRVATYAFTGSAGQQRVPATFLEDLPFPELSEGRQNEIVALMKAARDDARRLRAEAEAGWQAAKDWFEDQLLGPECHDF